MNDPTVTIPLADCEVAARWLQSFASSRPHCPELGELAKRLRAAAKKPNKTSCRWTYDDTHEKWDTGCETAFQFDEATPRENGYTYCPKCGKRIE